MSAGMAVPFRRERRHKPNSCFYKKANRERIRYQPAPSIARIGFTVVCAAGTIGIGVLVKGADSAQPLIHPLEYICTALAPVPPPPMPTPDQDFARAYTNSILELIRTELGCG